MELYEIAVDTQPSLTLPWDETRLMPVGDVQAGASGADIDKFKRHIDWGMKQGAYFISMGDMVDMPSPSGRRKIKNADFYDSVMDDLTDAAERHLEEILSIVRGTEGRWLGWLEGHHYWDFGGGVTTDTILAQKTKAPFLGTCSIVQLKFNDGNKHGIKCQIWSHHGEGSGMTMAAPLNKLERMMSRFPTVDIFILGHYSRKAGYPVDALVPVFGKRPKLVAKRRILAVTGGFAKGYEAGSRRNGRAGGSYVEAAMMPPTNLGGVVIYIRPVHSGGESRLDLNISL
ncbi:hypothetical protein LCGC14_0364320 [marine sediment metagenome]|uniref:Calcineurin-like phosphoesterase domain-containing protein n=1 Tax=marine sediment metagenome TaxID=412755 RepID=A0A0F9VUE7_9ZZZZ